MSVEKMTTSGCYELPSYPEPAPNIQPLKAILAQLDKAFDPDTDVLRSNMIDVTVAGDSMQALFPDTPISLATDRLLRLAIAEELRIAQSVVSLRALQADRPAYKDALLACLSPDDQVIAREGFSALEARRAPAMYSTFLRRIIGEGHQSISASDGITVETAKSRYKSALKVWRGDQPECMNAILAQMPQWYPAARGSVVKDLPQNLTRINREVNEIAVRLSKDDFDYMAQSFADAGLTSTGIIAVFMGLNMTRDSDEGTPLYASWCYQERERYASKHREFLEGFRIRPIGKQANLISSDEASADSLNPAEELDVDPAPQTETDSSYYAAPVMRAVFADQPMQAEIIIRHFFEAMPLEDIAKDVEHSPSELEAQLTSALAVLANRFTMHELELLLRQGVQAID